VQGGIQWFRLSRINWSSITGGEALVSVLLCVGAKPGSWYSVEIIVLTGPAGAAPLDYLVLAESVQ